MQNKEKQQIYRIKTYPKATKKNAFIANCCSKYSFWNIVVR